MYTTWQLGWHEAFFVRNKLWLIRKNSPFFYNFQPIISIILEENLNPVKWNYVIKSKIFTHIKCINLCILKRNDEKSLLQGKFVPLEIIHPEMYIERLIGFFE